MRLKIFEGVIDEVMLVNMFQWIQASDAFSVVFMSTSSLAIIAFLDDGSWT